jgi:hypothetical protein
MKSETEDRRMLFLLNRSGLTSHVSRYLHASPSFLQEIQNSILRPEMIFPVVCPL